MSGDKMNMRKIEYCNARCEVFEFRNGSEVRECHVMIHVVDGEQPFNNQLEAIANAYGQLAGSELSGCTAVLKRYFLSDSSNQSEAVKDKEKTGVCAVSLIEQPPLDGTKVALWVYMLSNVRSRVTETGLYEISHSCYRHLWGASRHTLAANSEYQARQLLAEYSDSLVKLGCTLEANCMRTWFFVSGIDLNYGGVVRARNQVFFTQGLTHDTHFIASTGIGGRQADPNVLVQMDTYAIAGIDSRQIRYLYARDNMNRTSEYGVSFERGTAIDYADRRHVLISGTASIDNRGKVMYEGDIVKQTERMCQNVEALLKEAECTFADVGHMIVYLRDITDYSLVSKMFAERFSDKPYVIVHAPVCRPGWLIEMECMAVKAIDRPKLAEF